MRWLSSLLLAVLGVLAGCAGVPVPGASVQAQSCAAAASQPARDPRIGLAVEEARKQHLLFGGQRINRAGRIVKGGYHEAEFDRPRGESKPTWKRVADFWSALDPELPATFRSPLGGQVRIRDLLAPFTREAAGGASGLDEKQLSAIEAAFVRSAVVDHPWSATFISFLMKTSGFGPDEFAFSDSHVDYVDQAVLASAAQAQGEPTRSGWRACDIASTPPRPGDLICHTRTATAAITRYQDLLDALETRRHAPWPRAFPMHCDLVTRADEGGNARMESVGGNVFQSVTLRMFTLDAGKTLSERYFPSHPGRRCEPDNEFCDSNLSRRPWVVLLQFRG